MAALRRLAARERRDVFEAGELQARATHSSGLRLRLPFVAGRRDPPRCMPWD